jgi:hypothetical protein
MSPQRIAEKNLERRASRCFGYLEEIRDADLAIALLRAAGPIVEDLLGDPVVATHPGTVAARLCRFAAAAVEARWMDPRHALRFARECIEAAVECEVHP